MAGLVAGLHTAAAGRLHPSVALAWRAVGAEVLDVAVGCAPAAAVAVELASALCPTAPFVAAAVASRAAPGRVERALRGAADPHLRRVALAALVAAAARGGWDPPRLRLLERTYRVDPNPGVAGAAFWVDADEAEGAA